VTVFVSPEVAGGFTDVSVLVQSTKNGEVLLDADVSLAVDPPNAMATARSEPLCGPLSAVSAFELSDMNRSQATVPATREQASNKLLYAAALNLSAVGNWRLRVSVSRGSDSVRFDCLLPVTRTSAKQQGLWPWLMFPPVAIAAFAMNQRLRRHSLERGFECQ